VTRTDRTVQELRHALVIGDTLTGYAYRTGSSDSVRVTLALAEVRRIEGRARSAGTLLAMSAVLLVALFVGLMAFASNIA